jgi:hypothetical protein
MELDHEGTLYRTIFLLGQWGRFGDAFFDGVVE